METIQVVSQNYIENIQVKKSLLGQFMTPYQVADYMTSLFSQNTIHSRLLDCGAGLGILAISAIEKLKKIDKVDLWEIDTSIIDSLFYNVKETAVDFQIYNSDFIIDSVKNILQGHFTKYTHIIMNPPYKKMHKNSDHQQQLRRIGIETVNLYSAFLSLAIYLLEDKGELVAIIPRSFCNGVYYKSLRKLIYNICSIEYIHVFHSRNTVFKSDNVLQETIIIKLTKKKQQKHIVVSFSQDHLFNDYQKYILKYSDVIKPVTQDFFIYIPIVEEKQIISSVFTNSLNDIGVMVSTGPVVDFRVKDYWTNEINSSSVPLIYAHHFSNKHFIYPQINKKPNALQITPSVEKWLMDNEGYFVLVKRFSTKEEKRRIVAHVLDSEQLPYKKIGFENHWNVFHFEKKGISEKLAKGLACFMNSSYFDNLFRSFSGHTQVNVADLKHMKYPSRECIEMMGRYYNNLLSQIEIDKILQEFTDVG